MKKFFIIFIVIISLFIVTNNVNSADLCTCGCGMEKAICTCGG